MTCVKKKMECTRTLRLLVEGHREDGKVWQRMLAHLGQCGMVECALRWWPMRIVKLRLVALEAREKVAIVPQSFGRRGESGFTDGRGEMVRLCAGPRAHSVWPKLFDMYAGGEGEKGDWLYRFYADLNLHKHYWDYIDHAEKLERAADNLEERYVCLYELRGGTAAEKSALEGRLRRVAYAKRRLKEPRMAVLLAAWGFTPAG